MARRPNLHTSDDDDDDDADDYDDDDNDDGPEIFQISTVL